MKAASLRFRHSSLIGWIESEHLMWKSLISCSSSTQHISQLRGEGWKLKKKAQLKAEVLVLLQIPQVLHSSAAYSWSSSPSIAGICDTWIMVNSHSVCLWSSGLRPLPVAVRSLCGLVELVPPLLILQTMQPVNWRLTDTAKESHEGNVRVASVSVIPCSLRNVRPSPRPLASSSLFPLHWQSELLLLCLFVFHSIRLSDFYCVVKFHIFHPAHWWEVQESTPRCLCFNQQGTNC